MLQWITASLSRKLMMGLAAGLVLAALALVGLFMTTYLGQIEREKAEASKQLNRLLQASLENAMLKRDIPGLRAIVAQLGGQDGIVGVTIINPDGEVRFSSRSEALGRVLDVREMGLAPGTPGLTHSFTDVGGRDVVRSINPVHNKDECSGCHGPVSQHPVNGILIIDYDAEMIKRQALASALMLSGSSGLLIVFFVVGAFWFMKRTVSAPVHALTRAARALAEGDLDARARWRGGDEIAGLGRTFNEMAERLKQGLRDAQEKEAFLQSLIDAVPDGIRVIDAEFTIVKVNDAYCRQLGQTRSAVIGLPCFRSSHRRSDPCPPTLMTCPLAEIQANGRSLTCVQHHLDQDGHALHVEISAAPLEIDLHGYRGPLIVEVIRDLAQEIRYSQEQRLSEIGQLATGVAHEIHNPLASVRLGLQSILRKLEMGQVIDPSFAQYLKLVDGEVDKCISVTEKLLRISMPPGEYRDLVSLRDVIPDVLALLRYEAERIGVRTVLHLGAGPLRVVAADGEMRMLVLNLIQNAFHAMPGGGELRVRGAIEDRNVTFTVEDDGTGIPAERLARIFDPFYSRRADNARGTGLGLAICRAIVGRYGGRIEVTSTPGTGSTFKVILPDADAAGLRRQGSRR